MLKKTLRKQLVVIAGLAGLVIAGAAAAKDPIPGSGDNFVIYKDLGEWTVYTDADRESCLIERVDDAGNVMQMGLDKQHKHAYVGIFTLADIDIKNRQKVEILVDDALFEGKVHGIKSKKLKGDYSGGYVVLKDANMVTAIAEGQTMVAFPEKTGGLFVIDLTGTKNAIDEARKCNLEIAK
jgi:hypothetical protein